VPTPGGTSHSPTMSLPGTRRYQQNRGNVTIYLADVKVCPDEGQRDERQNGKGTGTAGERNDGAAGADEGPLGESRGRVGTKAGGPPSSYRRSQICL